MPRNCKRSSILKILERVSALHQLRIITTEQKNILAEHFKSLLKKTEQTECDVLFLYEVRHPLAEELCDWIKEL